MPRPSSRWGGIPVAFVIGTTTFETSLIPREGTSLLPAKAALRAAASLAIDGAVSARVTLGRGDASVVATKIDSQE